MTPSNAKTGGHGPDGADAGRAGGSAGFGGRPAGGSGRPGSAQPNGRDPGDAGPPPQGATIEVTATERGIVRVFAAPQAAPDLRKPDALRRALGSDNIDVARVDVVDMADLGAMTLPHYLMQAYDIPGDAPGMAALDGTSGTVLIVPTRALPAPCVLTPAPGLRLLARLTEATAPPAALDPLRTASAAGLVAGTPPVDRRRADRKASGYVALSALAFSLLVVLVMWLVAA